MIESRPGASGNVGAAAVARAAPDGYTLMIGTDAMMTSNVHLYKSMPFDPVKDFAPITNGGANIIVLAVHADLPVKTVAELIAYAKANPGKLQFGSSGVASPHHLAGELLKLKTGIDIVHVPYRGGGPVGERSGRRPYRAWRFCSYSSAAPLLPTGKIRIVGVVEKTRYAAMPGRADRRARPCRASRCRHGSACSRRPARRAPIVARLNDRAGEDPQDRR